MAIDSRRIAKNTVYMYFRMILIMLVSIYTSRVILEKLGIDDYGIYNAVASIVAMVTFLNATLSTSTSRFLTYDLGKDDAKNLRTTFSTSFYAHLALAGIMFLILESIGLWYMGHKFVIQPGTEVAVQIVYQISVLTTVIAVIQVPYTAAIIAHENMNIYAYIGIADVLMRLGIVYLLSIVPLNKLILYSMLIAAVQIIVILAYFLYSRNKYPETKLTRQFNKETLRNMMGFTGWTAVANLSNTMMVQGSTLLLNLFFAPAIIASQALANQITHAVMQFINNFRVALNPQIIKSCSAGRMEEFKKLSLNSTIIVCNLILLLGLPCMAVMGKIMSIWLVEVPPLAVAFTQLAILSQIFGTISSSTYIPFVATGKLKLNAIWGTVTGFGYFIALYVCFKLGGGALWVQWLFVILNILSALLVRPYLLHKEIGFSYKEIYICICNCLKPLFVAGFSAYLITKLFNEDLWQQIILFLVVFFETAAFIMIFLDSNMRKNIIELVKSKIKKKQIMTL